MKPDKAVDVLPVITQACLDADIKTCKKDRVTDGVNALYKQGLFRAVFTVEGITQMGNNWRMKSVQFDQRGKPHFDLTRLKTSKSFSSVLRHRREVSHDPCLQRLGDA